MKFEKINLEKFNSEELKGFQKSIIKGGQTTYMVSAPKDGDGTIEDAGIQHDSGLN